MIKIELVRFEAQDVITASVCAPTAHKYELVKEYTEGDLLLHDIECKVCGDKQTVIPNWVE